jgi:phosphatidylserine/phosphatidylglycerophosphate/cardiolipin synthase-like enzyme
VHNRLAAADLRAVAAALAAGRIEAPCTPLALRGLVGADQAGSVAARLAGLAARGCNAAVLAAAFEWLAEELEASREAENAAQVVASGPELAARSTAVVARDLFAHAEHSVLVAGYAVHQGKRVFAALARRLENTPGLRVRLFLDVRRGPGDTSAAGAVLARFAQRLWTDEWPSSSHRPEVYYDPRSLAVGSRTRAALHAKCAVVDGRSVFVTSANWTEAAQERNIELGLLLDSPPTAERITNFFDNLIGRGTLARLE